MPFTILALSGGGYLGLHEAVLLRELERALHKPIGEAFDLICGSSIGAVAAMAIAAGTPARDIEAGFLEHGARIFPSPLGQLRESLGSGKRGIVKLQQAIARRIRRAFDPKVAIIENVSKDIVRQLALGGCHRCIQASVLDPAQRAQTAPFACQAPRAGGMGVQTQHVNIRRGHLAIMGGLVQAEHAGRVGENSRIHIELAAQIGQRKIGRRGRRRHGDF